MNNSFKSPPPQPSPASGGASGPSWMLKAMGAALALLLAPFAAASAQDWPIRAVTMIVPYAAGGPVDTLGRILAARLSEILGQQVVVENVPGAGGMTGASRAAKAAPDGYTVLLSGSAVLAINQTLYKKPLYNAVTDFEHVALFSDSARVLVTRNNHRLALYSHSNIDGPNRLSFRFIRSGHPSKTDPNIRVCKLSNIFGQFACTLLTHNSIGFNCFLLNM